jgi:hypothetical protein
MAVTASVEHAATRSRSSGCARRRSRFIVWIAKHSWRRRSHECAEGAYIEEDQMSSDTMMFSDCLGLTANSTGNGSDDNLSRRLNLDAPTKLLANVTYANLGGPNAGLSLCR